MVLGNINIHAQNPDFLFMVEYAIKAPSGHNTQPWLFRINENSILKSLQSLLDAGVVSREQIEQA